MRDTLITLAAAAGAWAIAVLGIATNRPFGAFLLVIALLLVISAHYIGRLAKWWKKARWFVRVPALLSVLATCGLGWYLGTAFNESAQTTDPVARQQIADLKAKDLSDIQVKMAALTGQIETAMKFQEGEKTAREQRERQLVADKVRRSKATEMLGRFIESGGKLDLEIRQSRVSPLERVDKWVTELETALRALDESYVTRSRSGAGIALSGRQWSTPPSPELSSALAILDVRRARLAEFMRELADRPPGTPGF